VKFLNKINYENSKENRFGNRGISGTAEAIVLAFASDNFEVIICGRNSEKGNALIDKIEKMGGKTTFYDCDFSVKNGLDDLFKKINKKYPQGQPPLWT
jgi:short-subunit dehydrogenase